MGSSVLRGDLDLAGDGGGDQRGAALLRELDEPLRLGDERVDLCGLPVDLLSNAALQS